MKRTIALLLACAMLCPLFAACGKDDTPDVSTDSTTASTEATKNPNAPDFDPETLGDISGDFNILVSGNYARNDFAAESGEGTAVQNAVYRRNEYMREKFNVNITNEDIIKFNSATGSGAGFTKLYTDYISGDKTYDAAMVGTYDVATLAYSGYIHDLNALENINLSKPYWDQKANADLSIGGKMFYTTGDITIIDNMVTNAILFNKDMIKNYGLDNPYTLVEDNEWTLEKFGSMVKAVGEDKDQNGIYDSNDTYGLLTWNDAMLSILGASGEKICSINDDKLELTFYNERVVSLYDKWEEIVFDQAHSYNYQYDNVAGKATAAASWDEARIRMFDSEQALFYTTLLTTVDKHRNSETDFGILPFPKYDSNQADYGHTVSAFHCAFICVPTLAASPRVGAILEELAYQGQQLLTPAYYDQTLIGQYTRDEESAAMLDLIFATRVYDVGIYYTIGDYKTALGRLYLTRSALSSLYDANLGQAEKKMDQINQVFAITAEG